MDDDFWLSSAQPEGVAYSLARRLRAFRISLLNEFRRRRRRKLFSFAERPVIQPVRSRLIFIRNLVDGIGQRFLKRDETIATLRKHFYQLAKVIGVEFVGMQQKDLLDGTAEQFASDRLTVVNFYPCKL